MRFSYHAGLCKARADDDVLYDVEDRSHHVAVGGARHVHVHLLVVIVILGQELVLDVVDTIIVGVWSVCVRYEATATY